MQKDCNSALNHGALLLARHVLNQKEKTFHTRVLASASPKGGVELSKRGSQGRTKHHATKKGNNAL